MHIPYETRLGHPADFMVKYRFLTVEEGGREQLPFQGIRNDFSYSRDDNRTYMIWPEVLDENGSVILDNTVRLPREGKALMWIISASMRKVHQERIAIGTTGYFREGKMTAECKVIEILGLHTNPTV